MNPADTAFIILCATFVMLMTPALALFYGGLVRSKNILSTCMHSYASLGMVSIIWALFGYSLAFSGDISGLIGNLDHVFLMGVGGEANGPAANLPHNVFMAFQCMFAALTVALISGAYAERIRFSAMLVFSALWTVFAYCLHYARSRFRGSHACFGHRLCRRHDLLRWHPAQEPPGL